VCEDRGSVAGAGLPVLKTNAACRRIGLARLWFGFQLFPSRPSRVLCALQETARPGRVNTGLENVLGHKAPAAVADLCLVKNS
jgi:hypothetical protein